MKQRITTLFAGGLVVLVLFGVAAAGPLEDFALIQEGSDAYSRGDY